MEFKEWLVIIGWPVSVFIGCFVTYFAYKLKQQRRRLAWSLEFENELVSPELSEHAGAAVRLTVADQAVQALAVVSLKIACTGNKAVGRLAGNEQVLEFKIRMGSEAKILDVQLSTESAESRRHTSHTSESDGIRIERVFMNPGDEVWLRLLVADYKLGSLDVQFTYPDVTLQRVTPSEYLRLNLSTTSFAFSLLGIGVRTDPSTVALYEINRSLKSIESRLIGSSRAQREPASHGAEQH